ncbi:hypothetical protein GGE12_000341 [Rhizobium mongolense]|uniref:Uncharacterized protein n=1 Tax=Rhizobium mongolense TaxID=57676 RepID=A0A7W6WCJ5_9HYPH|nr:hypothetical protein [Rhizobium mongolense]
MIGLWENNCQSRPHAHIRNGVYSFKRSCRPDVAALSNRASRSAASTRMGSEMHGPLVTIASLSRSSRSARCSNLSRKSSPRCFARMAEKWSLRLSVRGEGVDLL